MKRKLKIRKEPSRSAIPSSSSPPTVINQIETDQFPPQPSLQPELQQMTRTGHGFYTQRTPFMDYKTNYAGMHSEFEFTETKHASPQNSQAKIEPFLKIPYINASVSAIPSRLTSVSVSSVLATDTDQVNASVSAVDTISSDRPLIPDVLRAQSALHGAVLNPISKELLSEERSEDAVSSQQNSVTEIVVNNEPLGLKKLFQEPPLVSAMQRKCDASCQAYLKRPKKHKTKKKSTKRKITSVSVGTQCVYSEKYQRWISPSKISAASLTPTKDASIPTTPVFTSPTVSLPTSLPTSAVQLSTSDSIFDAFTTVPFISYVSLDRSAVNEEVPDLISKHPVSEVQNKHEVTPQQSGATETVFDVEHLELQQVKPHFGPVNCKNLVKKVGEFPVLTKQTNSTKTVADTEYLEMPQLIPFKAVEDKDLNKEFTELFVRSKQQSDTPETMFHAERLKPQKLIPCELIQDKKILEAFTKPPIQKYVIDGFVIAESSEPFAVVFHSGLVDSPYRISPPKNYRDYILCDFNRKRKLEFGESDESRKKALIEHGEANITPQGENGAKPPEVFNQSTVFKNTPIKSLVDNSPQLSLKEVVSEFEVDFTVPNKTEFESTIYSSDFSETQLLIGNDSSGSDQIQSKHFTEEFNLSPMKEELSKSDDDITISNKIYVQPSERDSVQNKLELLADDESDKIEDKPIRDDDHAIVLDADASKFDEDFTILNKIGIELSESNFSDSRKTELESFTDDKSTDDGQIEEHFANSYNVIPMEEKASESNDDTPASNKFNVKSHTNRDSSDFTKVKFESLTDDGSSGSNKIDVEHITYDYHLVSMEEAAPISEHYEVSNKMDFASSTNTYSSDSNKTDVKPLTNNYIIPMQNAPASADECTVLNTKVNVLLTDGHYPITVAEDALESADEYTGVDQIHVDRPTRDNFSDSNKNEAKTLTYSSPLIPMDKDASVTDSSMVFNKTVIDPLRNNFHPVLMDKDKPEAVSVIESDFRNKLPTKWTVQDVFMFIQNLPFCSEYANEFKSEEIDGRALLLLKECHLITDLGMKQGPALKLKSRLQSMKELCGEF